MPPGLWNKSELLSSSVHGFLLRVARVEIVNECYKICYIVESWIANFSDKVQISFDENFNFST